MLTLSSPDRNQSDMNRNAGAFFHMSLGRLLIGLAHQWRATGSVLRGQR